MIAKDSPRGASERDDRLAESDVVSILATLACD